MSSELVSLLVAQTWQVTLLFIVVWITVKLFAKDRPHLAHALWLLLLIKCLTPPVFSSPTSAFSWLNYGPSFAQNTESLSETSGKRSWTEPLARNQFSDLQSADSIVVHAIPEDDANQTELLGSEPTQNTESKSPVPDIAINSRTFGWSTTVCLLWFIGVCIGLLGTTIRFARFVFWTRTCNERSNPSLQSLVKKLGSKLGIRRLVRIRILDQPVGPAVTGLFRPTILLPSSIVQGRPLTELEPLIAHELIHIRRGDLWWALVQTFAQNLFWFHPLVRLATRMLTWESERSCDEETVASLGCSPAAYAKGLLEVLEHKHRLRVAPALPGVRPVDITSARLERVMNLGNGIHRRTPLWTWMVLAVCCATVLPGAALVFGQELEETAKAETLPRHHYEEQNGTWATVVIPKSTTTEVPFLGKIPYVGRLFKNVGISSEHSAKPPRSALETWEIVSCQLNGLAKKWNATQPQGGHSLENVLGSYTPGAKGRDPIQSNRKAELATDAGILEFGNGMPTMQIVGDTIYSFGPQEVHERLVADIARLNHFGFNEIILETRMLTLPKDQLETIGIEWLIAPVAAKGVFKHTPDDSADSVHSGGRNRVINQYAANLIGADTWHGNTKHIDDNDLVSSATEQGIAAVSFVEKNSPVLYATIDEKKYQQVIASVKVTPESQLLNVPTVTMYNGQNASVVTGQSRPFVVGLEQVTDEARMAHANQPIIQVIHDGRVLKVNAEIIENEGVNLDCRLEHTRILKVGTIEFPMKGLNGKSATIQVPEVATTRIQSSLDVPAGKTLVLSNIQKNAEGEEELFVAFLTCRLLGNQRDASPTGADSNQSERSDNDELSEARSEVPFFNNLPEGMKIESIAGVDLAMQTSHALSVQSAAPTKTGAQSFTVEDDSSPLFGATFEGNLQIESNDGHTTIQGEELTVKINDMTFKGKQGLVKVSPNGWIVEMSAAATCDIDDGVMTLKADRLIRSESNDHLDGVALKGNAQVRTICPGENWQASADSILLGTNQLKLDGKGTFQRNGANPRRVSADLIRVDMSTLTITTPDSIPKEGSNASEKVRFTIPIDR